MNKDYIYTLTEKKANRFNMYCLIAISILSILAIILNELHIFTQDRLLMITSMLSLAVSNTIPLIIYIINDKILKRKTILESKYYKIIILFFAYTSIFIVCVVLSFQATLLLVIPLLFAAQYRNERKMFLSSLITSLIMIVIITYGNFFFGIYDANLLKPLTASEALVFENRVNTATSKRMLEIFLHYALPKMMCITALHFISGTINKRTAEMVSIQIELNDKINEEIKKKTEMQKSVIEDLADIIESRDIETGEHIKRTKKYVSILVDAMKKDNNYKDILTDTFCDNIINAAPLHDIGKIVVSDLILCKPGKLTNEEFEKMKIHTTKGGEIVKNILNDLGDEEFLNVAYDIATFHHEKWNGMGYPNNLKGNEIPLPARIMAIADVFDALVAERVYKKPMPANEAVNIIISDAGSHFDPNLVEIFKNVKDEFVKYSKEKL